MAGRIIPRLAIAFTLIAMTPVFACEIRVRDSAFRTTRDVHKLCVIGTTDDASADAIHDQLTQWLESTDGTLNLDVVRIRADDPELDWRTVGIPSAPPTMPVTVLVGRDNGIGEYFLIDHWEAAPSDVELAAVRDSPIRGQLATELASHLAVLVFAPSVPSSQHPADAHFDRCVSLSTRHVPKGVWEKSFEQITWVIWSSD